VSFDREVHGIRRSLPNRLITRTRQLQRAGLRRASRLRASRRPEPPICHDLAAWSSSWPGAERWALEPASAISRALPSTIEPDVHPDFVRLATFSVPERALVKIPRARLRGEAGLVILPTGEFAGELVALTREGRHTLLRDQHAYRAPLPKRIEVKAGNYYVAIAPNSEHYYHWSHDVVMRMRGIGHLLPADAQIVVPGELAPFQRETLSLLGLDDRPRVSFPGRGVWELENLYIVSPILKAQIDTAEPYRWFRERSMARYGIEPGEPSRRFYLTRRYDKHWRTVNEADVEASLSRHGFETVAPGTMTFRQQIELFRHAEMIVGTGAGLFNMVFAPPDVKVLQLQETNHMELALWMMADAIGVEYHYLVGEAVRNDEGRQVDIRVPIDKLERSIAAMAGTPAP
jgi:capsular polysaccharide biosynthesis protein